MSASPINHAGERRWHSTTHGKDEARRVGMLHMSSIWPATVAVNQAPIVGEQAVWHLGDKQLTCTIKAAQPWKDWPLNGSVDFVCDEPHNGKTIWQMKYVLPDPHQNG